MPLRPLHPPPSPTIPRPAPPLSLPLSPPPSQSRGIRLALVNPSRSVMQTLTRAGIPQLLGHQWFFVRIFDAVQLCKADMDRR